MEAGVFQNQARSKLRFRDARVTNKQFALVAFLVYLQKDNTAVLVLEQLTVGDVEATERQVFYSQRDLAVLNLALVDADSQIMSGEDI